MAFKGNLAAVSGRQLSFGKRDDAIRRYEREFTLAPNGKVLRGEWPDLDRVNLSDLKNGMEVRCCGVGGDAVSGECHSVVISGKPSSRVRTHELADRQAAINARAAKKK